MNEYIHRNITKRIGDKIYHRFYNKRGIEIEDKEFIKQVSQGIYIPPAYDNVKIYVNPSRKR